MSSEGPGETARKCRLAWAPLLADATRAKLVNVDLSDPVEADVNLVFKIIFF